MPNCVFFRSQSPIIPPKYSPLFDPPFTHTTTAERQPPPLRRCADYAVLPLLSDNGTKRQKKHFFPLRGKGIPAGKSASPCGQTAFNYPRARAYPRANFAPQNCCCKLAQKCYDIAKDERKPRPLQGAELPRVRRSHVQIKAAATGATAETPAGMGVSNDENPSKC